MIKGQEDRKDCPETRLENPIDIQRRISMDLYRVFRASQAHPVIRVPEVSKAIRYGRIILRARTSNFSQGVPGARGSSGLPGMRGSSGAIGLPGAVGNGGQFGPPVRR